MSDRVKVRLQAEGTNLNDVLGVIDFGGLFSGNAIGPSRSFGLRMTTTFDFQMRSVLVKAGAIAPPVIEAVQVS